MENAGFQRFAVTLIDLADCYDQEAERIINNQKNINLTAYNGITIDHFAIHRRLTSYVDLFKNSSEMLCYNCSK